MCNLYVAIDIEATELRNRRSTCENYLWVWARDCKISFFLSVTLYSPFFRPSLLFTPFSRSPSSLLFGWRLTILNSQFRCSIAVSLRPVSPAIRKRTEIRSRRCMPSVNIVQRALPRSWKSHGSMCLYRCERCEQIYERIEIGKNIRFFGNNQLLTAPILIFQRQIFSWSSHLALPN